MLDAPPAPPSTVARPDEDLLAEAPGAAPADERERRGVEGHTEGGQEGEGLADRVKDALTGPDEPERRTGR